VAGGRQAGLIRDRLSQTDRIQQRLGLAFNRPSLLVEALTHPSYLNENPGLRAASYQRLEFLGDAILGLVTALELFQRYPELSEGELTRLRSHLVQERSLARMAAELDLGDYLDMGRGEEASGGRCRDSNLAAALEALIGAVHLDQGADIAKTLILDLVADEIERAEKSGAPQDPKSQLQEIVQSRYQTTPLYELVASEGPDHARRFTIEVIVAGRVSEESFWLYAFAADICLNLRYPSAGETSATLLRLLACGRPVMVTDQIHVADFPDSVVARSRLEGDEDGLYCDLMDLIRAPHRRRELSESSRAFVLREHSVQAMVEDYREALDNI